MKCKVGLISRPYNVTDDCLINLGEIFDLKIKNDVNLLYELHKNIKYLYPFQVFIESNKIILDNIEEISAIQSRYKLTRKPIMLGNSRKKRIKFNSPELYDISCMVPLFSDKQSIPKYIENKTSSLSFAFILFPYDDPILRGEIVDSCLNISKGEKVYFYILGKIRGMNRVPTCKLSKRYLLKHGLANIFTQEYDKFPDCIDEAVNMIKFSLDPSVKILIGIDRKDMSNVMKNIRKKKLTKQITLICN